MQPIYIIQIFFLKFQGSKNIMKNIMKIVNHKIPNNIRNS